MAIGLLISCVTEHQMVAALLSFAIFIVMYLLPNITDMFPSSGIFTVVFLVILALLPAWLFYSETKDIRITLISGAAPIGIIVGMYVWKSEIFDNGISNIVSWFSLLDRFNDFISGVLNASSVVYYVSFIVASLFIGTQILERRRWK